jgi:hypothetical protein
MTRVTGFCLSSRTLADPATAPELPRKVALRPASSMVVSETIDGKK